MGVEDGQGSRSVDQARKFVSPRALRLRESGIVFKPDPSVDALVNESRGMTLRQESSVVDRGSDLQAQDSVINRVSGNVDLKAGVQSIVPDIKAVSGVTVAPMDEPQIPIRG
jgi:hypothetical protein